MTIWSYKRPIRVLRPYAISIKGPLQALGSAGTNIRAVHQKTIVATC